MGPRRAAEQFREQHPQAEVVRVTLYGSLSLTGQGHLTDRAIIDGLRPLRSELVWSRDSLPFHPNGMQFEALDAGGERTAVWTVFSVGGGELREKGQATVETADCYPQRSLREILQWADQGGKPL